jgi:hypothetical protein
VIVQRRTTIFLLAAVAGACRKETSATTPTQAPASDASQARGNAGVANDGAPAQTDAAGGAGAGGAAGAQGSPDARSSGSDTGAANDATGPVARMCDDKLPWGKPCNGFCKPEVVFQNSRYQNGPDHSYAFLAPDGRRLFVRTTGPDVTRLSGVDLPPTGPVGVPTLLHTFDAVDGVIGPDSLALDATYVYWLRTGGYNVTDKVRSFQRKAFDAGVAAKPTQLFESEQPSLLGTPVIAGGQLVFAGQVATSTNIYSGFFTLPVDGGTPTQLLHLKGHDAVKMLVIQDRIFWIEWTADHKVLTAALSGGPIEELDNGAEAVLTSDDQAVYWAIGLPSAVGLSDKMRRVPISRPVAAEVRDVAKDSTSDGSLQSGVVSDGEYLYYTQTLATWSLLRLRTEGAFLPEVVANFADQSDFVWVVGVDCRHVYAYGASGSIVRIPKPSGPLLPSDSPCTSHAQCASHLCGAMTCGSPAKCLSAYRFTRNDQVCGCDGVTYDNDLAAWGAGNLAFTMGRCKPDGGP